MNETGLHLRVFTDKNIEYWVIISSKSLLTYVVSGYHLTRSVNTQEWQIFSVGLGDDIILHLLHFHSSHRVLQCMFATKRYLRHEEVVTMKRIWSLITEFTYICQILAFPAQGSVLQHDSVKAFAENAIWIFFGSISNKDSNKCHILPLFWHHQKMKYHRSVGTIKNNRYLI